MPKKSTRYVRQMPKIYGDLQRPKRSYAGLVRWIRNTAWGLAAVALVYTIWLSGWFNVHSVDVQGATFSSADQIRQMVPAGTNIWFVSKDALSNRIMHQPSVDGVSILRGIPDSIRIVVHEKQPALVWVSGGTAYVLDRDGYSFASFDQANPPAADGAVGALINAVPRVVDVKTVPVKVGTQVASPVFIDFITSVRTELAAQLPQLTVDHVEIAETTYDVTFFTKQGVKVQMNSLGDAPSQVRNLSRLITQENLNTATASVDLRVDRWAYVTP